jgi:hypothetical protein
MAKIEKPSCFFDDNLEKIVELCNGIMVARGDLGVECTLSKFYPCAFTLVCFDTHNLACAHFHLADRSTGGCPDSAKEHY